MEKVVKPRQPYQILLQQPYHLVCDHTEGDVLALCLHEDHCCRKEVHRCQTAPFHFVNGGNKKRTAQSGHDSRGHSQEWCGKRKKERTWIQMGCSRWISKALEKLENDVCATLWVGGCGFILVCVWIGWVQNVVLWFGPFFMAFRVTMTGKLTGVRNKKARRNLRGCSNVCVHELRRGKRRGKTQSKRQTQYCRHVDLRAWDLTSVQKLNLRRWRRAQPPRQEFRSSRSSYEKPLTQHCAPFSSGKYALQAASTHADAAKKAVSTLGAQTGPASLHTCSPPSDMALHIQNGWAGGFCFPCFFTCRARAHSHQER